MGFGARADAPFTDELTMLLSDHLIFVHVMKTAGTSMTSELLRILPGEVHAIGKVDVMPKHTAGRVTHLPGNHHTSLAQARPALWYHYGGVPLDAMPPVVAVIRNPYDRAHSFFAWAERDRANNVDHAMAESGFSSFILQDRTRRTGAYRSTAEYLLIDKIMPPNLRLLRFEHLAEDFATLAKELGLPAPELPVLNRSFHGHYRDELSAEAELAIFENEEWLFQHGFYEREVVSDLFPSVPFETSSAVNVPISGPAELTSGFKGLLADGWVDTSLRFTVRATAPIQSVELCFTTPDPLPDNTAAVALVDAIPHGRPVSAGETVHWTIPLVLQPHQEAAITLATTNAAPSSSRNEGDVRHLRFHLSHISVMPDPWPSHLGGGLVRSGPASGLYPDGWLAPQATVGLRATWPATAIDVSCFISEGQPLPQTIVLVVGDTTRSIIVEEPGLVSMRMPVSAKTEDKFSLEIMSYPTWHPSSHGDQRMLGVVLVRIAATTAEETDGTSA